MEIESMELCKKNKIATASASSLFEGRCEKMMEIETRAERIMSELISESPDIRSHGDRAGRQMKPCMVCMQPPQEDFFDIGRYRMCGGLPGAYRNLGMTREEWIGSSVSDINYASSNSLAPLQSLHEVIKAEWPGAGVQSFMVEGKDPHYGVGVMSPFVDVDGKVCIIAWSVRLYEDLDSNSNTTDEDGNGIWVGSLKSELDCAIRFLLKVKEKFPIDALHEFARENLRQYLTVDYPKKFVWNSFIFSVKNSFMEFRTIPAERHSGVALPDGQIDVNGENRPLNGLMKSMWMSNLPAMYIERRAGKIQSTMKSPRESTRERSGSSSINPDWSVATRRTQEALEWIGIGIGVQNEEERNSRATSRERSYSDLGARGRGTQIGLSHSFFDADQPITLVDSSTHTLDDDDSSIHHPLPNYSCPTSIARELMESPKSMESMETSRNARGNSPPAVLRTPEWNWTNSFGERPRSSSSSSKSVPFPGRSRTEPMKEEAKLCLREALGDFGRALSYHGNDSTAPSSSSQTPNDQDKGHRIPRGEDEKRHHDRSSSLNMLPPSIFRESTFTARPKGTGKNGPHAKVQLRGKGNSQYTHASTAYDSPLATCPHTRRTAAGTPVWSDQPFAHMHPWIHRMRGMEGYAYTHTDQGHQQTHFQGYASIFPAGGGNTHTAAGYFQYGDTDGRTDGRSGIRENDGNIEGDAYREGSWRNSIRALDRKSFLSTGMSCHKLHSEEDDHNNATVSTTSGGSHPKGSHDHHYPDGNTHYYPEKSMNSALSPPERHLDPAGAPPFPPCLGSNDAPSLGCPSMSVNDAPNHDDNITRTATPLTDSLTGPAQSTDHSFSSPKPKRTFLRAGHRVVLHSFEQTLWLDGLTATVNKVFSQPRKNGLRRVRVQIMYDDPRLACNDNYPTIIPHRNLRRIDG